MRHIEHFLASGSLPETAAAVTLTMFISINLEGKKQCIRLADGNQDTGILVKLIKLLDRNKAKSKPVQVHKSD